MNVVKATKVVTPAYHKCHNGDKKTNKQINQPINQSINQSINHFKYFGHISPG